MRTVIVAIIFPLFASAGWAQTAEKPVPKKVPELFKLSADQFMARFDKNKDGVLTRDELPPFLQKTFMRWDTNGDAKLDSTEVSRMLEVIRQGMGTAPAAKVNPQAEKIVADMLQRLDTNKDGKISQAEAKGKPLAKAFATFDKNKDGFLDRAELRVAAAQFARGPKGPAGVPAFAPAQPDFDALDADADGRLTREELRASPLLQQFEQIDSNRDGRIDRREFEAYLKRRVKN